jgi:DNA-binding transcriptional LysR family regulator
LVSDRAAVTRAFRVCEARSRSDPATNRAIDLIEDNIDIAIRARVRSADEVATMRMLGKSELIFVASPAFATAQRASVGIDTLAWLPFLSFLEETARPTWTLSGPNGATKTLSFDPVLRSHPGCHISAALT